MVLLGSVKSSGTLPKLRYGRQTCKKLLLELLLKTQDYGPGFGDWLGEDGIGGIGDDEGVVEVGLKVRVLVRGQRPATFTVAIKLEVKKRAGKSGKIMPTKLLR